MGSRGPSYAAMMLSRYDGVEGTGIEDLAGVGGGRMLSRLVIFLKRPPGPDLAFGTAREVLAAAVGGGEVALEVAMLFRDEVQSGFEGGGTARVGWADARDPGLEGG